MDKGTCEINVATRNACRYCRFQRCIKVGMSVEGRVNYLSLEITNYLGSRIGRQSNLFKHHMRKLRFRI
jgi:hypothetical protein